MKRTYQPSKLKSKKQQGFLKRSKSQGGRNVLKSRRLKGRKKSIRLDYFLQICKLAKLSKNKYLHYLGEVEDGIMTSYQEEIDGLSGGYSIDSI